MCPFVLQGRLPVEPGSIFRMDYASPDDKDADSSAKSSFQKKQLAAVLDPSELVVEHWQLLGLRKEQVREGWPIARLAGCQCSALLALCAPFIFLLLTSSAADYLLCPPFRLISSSS